ncbi:conjugative transposon protein TraM [Mangrovibacterium lignilyticum]|uniref:conjugative transposon protein TraM n=1 Tax=Mangrovibacterium lignilyticum TaxID=2668052 RepID=UPI0013D219EC|nr:conjugative transposon protein TraM [Mangrovibacterium lignilyticum]
MQTYLKRNKPLLFLPLVLIPFVVLIFYILGGGENPASEQTAEQSAEVPQGANYELPDADHKLEIRDKTELDQSSGDITLTHDYNILGEDGGSKVDSTGHDDPEEVPEAELSVNNNDPDELLKHIQRREKQIRTELDDGEDTPAKPEPSFRKAVSRKPSQVGEATKASEKESGTTLPVTGIEELDRVFRQNKQLSRQNDSLRLNLQKAEAFQKQVEAERQQSFRLQKGGTSVFKPSTVGSSQLKAEVYETTTVLTGNRLKLRLLDDATITGIRLPAGSFLYGTCEVANERLRIAIRQLPVGDSFIPVDISVYDLDGMEGLYVPDNASRKVMKEVGSSTNTSSMFGVTGNPLTYAGVQAADRTAQSLLRMVRIKRVTIKKNTQVWLINQSK